MTHLDQRLTELLGNLPKVTEYTLLSLDDAAQRAILQSQVFCLEDNVFVFKDVPKQSITQLDLMFQRLLHLSADHPQWYLLVDLRDVATPEAEVRAHLRACYEDLAKKGLLFASVVVANRIIELAVKMVANRRFSVPYYCSHDPRKALNHLLSIRQSGVSLET